MARKARKTGNTEIDERFQKALESRGTALDLSGCDLTELPEPVLRMDALRSLNLSNNKLTDLPRELGRLGAITDLNLRANPLRGIPEVVFTLRALAVLDLASLGLTALDPRVGEMPALWLLNLYDNPLAAVPVELARMPKLSALFLSNCAFREIPPTLFDCTGLTRLNIDGNRITGVPGTLRRLARLRVLDIGNNALTELPDIFADLPELEEIEINGNAITSLPPSLRTLTKLRRLVVRGNPLGLPPESENLPAQDLLTVYFSLHAPPGAAEMPTGPTAPLNEAKMLVVGQGGVGKTSLIRRLRGEEFDSAQAETKGISVVSMAAVTAHGALDIKVWDFGGQEIMHATHQFFFTERSLYVLVIDSRQGEQESRLEYWLKLIGSFAGDSPVIVVCNRADENEIDLDWNGLRRKYPAIRHFVRAVSAKSNAGVAELRQAVEATVATLEHVHQPYPESWLRVKDRLAGMGRQQSFVTYPRYQAICAEEGEADAARQKALVRLLTALGTVLNFAEDRRLKDTNVLNPNWVTSGVYAILNNNALFQAHGVLDMAELAAILPAGEYPADQHEFIIEMMKKFELCFAFQDGADRFLIADLLPLSAPDTGDWVGALHFEYHYDVLPGSVISRFIVRMHAFISKQTYWRRGVVLERDGHRALVHADVEDRVIRVAVAGRTDDRRSMLDLIRADFERIHATLPKMRVVEQVPVPGHAGALVEYQLLVKLLRQGVSTHHVNGADGLIEIRVGTLLGEIESPERRDLNPRPEPELSPKTPPPPARVHPLFVFVVGFAVVGGLCFWAGWGAASLAPALIVALLLVVIVHAVEQDRLGVSPSEAFRGLVRETYAVLPLLSGKGATAAKKDGGTAGKAKGAKR